MVQGIVYTIKDNEVVDEFELEYEQAVAGYFGMNCSKGKYYVARKGIKIPYKKKKIQLKNIIRQHEEHQE